MSRSLVPVRTRVSGRPMEMTHTEHMVAGLVSIASGLVRVVTLGRWVAGWELSYALRCALRKSREVQP